MKNHPIEVFGLSVMARMTTKGFSELSPDVQIFLVLQDYLYNPRSTVVSGTSHNSCELHLGNVDWEKFFTAAGEAEKNFILYHANHGSLNGIDLENPAQSTDVYLLYDH